MLQGTRLWLMPHGLVHLPLEFQAWQHGHVGVDDASIGPDGLSAKALRVTALFKVAVCMYYLAHGSQPR